MTDFSVFDLLDRHLLRETIPDFRLPHLYPSEASVIDRKGQVHGSCLRSVWYRLNRVPPSNPPDARAMWIFELGLAVEELIIRKSKEVGVWFDDHVKWFNPKFHVSGEVDLIIRHPEKPDWLIGVECKSFYGYAAATEIMGNRVSPGFPKIHQLLQTLLYVDWFKEIIPQFKMVYLDRGATENRRDFTVEIHEVWKDDQLITYPVVNGKIHQDFSLQDIYRRFQEVWEYYHHGELPARDYQLYYSKEEMSARIAAGLVSNTDAEGFKRHPNRLKYRRASWQCRYCTYRNHCWDFSQFTQDQIRDLVNEGNSR